MNKAAGLLLVAFGLSVESSGFAAEESILATPEPGMQWRQEVLPLAQKTPLPSGPPNESSENSRTPEPTEAPFVEEENSMGQGFLAQKLQLRPGKFITRYIQGGLAVYEGLNGKAFSIELLDESIPGGMASLKRFNGFEWLQAKWLVGSALVDGVSCDIYVAPWPVPPVGEPAAAPAKHGSVILAAIGKSDRLPRRLETQYLVRRFTILPRVHPPPLLPDGVKALIVEFQRKIEAQSKAVRFAE